MNCKNVIYFTSEINYCIIPSFDGIDDGGYFGGGGGVSNSGNNVATNIDLSLFDRLTYPILGKIVDGLYNKVKNDPKLMAALKKFTHLDEQKILENLKSGQGPKLIVKDMPNIAGHYTAELNRMEIGRHLVESTDFKLTTTASVLELYIAITILHEFVHFGEHFTQNFLPHKNSYDDAGFQFEKYAFGGKVYYNSRTGIITYE